MKKRILVLALVPLLTLVSCGKTVTRQEARDFAKETYDYSKIEYTKCSSKMVQNVKKADGFFSKMFTLGKTEETVDNPINNVKFTSEAFNDNYKFTINGKKITVSYSRSAKEYLIGTGFDASSIEKATIKGNGLKETFYYNELGLLSKYVTTIDLTFSVSNLGVTVEGAISYSLTCTNSYSK